MTDTVFVKTNVDRQTCFGLFMLTPTEIKFILVISVWVHIYTIFLCMYVYVKHIMLF